MPLLRRTKLLLLACLVITAWSIFQIYNVFAHGQIFSGPHHNIRWISFGQEPSRFVTGIIVRSLILLIVCACTSAVLRWGDR